MTDTTTETEAPERAPMPLDVLADHVFEDSSSDYNDGVGGWTTAVFDSATGVLTISYKRDDDLAPEMAEQDPDYAHGPAEYRFRLTDPGDAPAGRGSELAYYRDEAFRLKGLAEEREAQLRFAAAERDRYRAALERIGGGIDDPWPLARKALERQA